MSGDLPQCSPDNSSTTSSNLLQNLEQEVNDQVEILNVVRKECQKKQILLSLIEEFIKDESKPAQLRKRVKNVLIAQEIKQDNQNVLGVSLYDELTESEGRQLSIFLEGMLDTKIKALKDKPPKKRVNESLLELSQEDSEILELITELNKQQELFTSQRKQLLELIEQQKQTRCNAVPEMMEEKLAQVTLNTNFNNLEAKLVDLNYRIEMFNETPIALDAYKTLLEDMKEEENKLKQEIEQLKELKQKYAEVSSCPEYNDILKSYLHCLEELERKKRMNQITM